MLKMKGSEAIIGTTLAVGGTVAYLTWLWIQSRSALARRDRELIAQLQRELLHEKIKRKDDRTGRTRAERLLRDQVLRQNPAGVSSLRPIAVARSIFKDRRGTPRQGILAPNSRAVLEFSNEMQAKQLMEGLENFSHVWLIWVFHHNTNVVKSAFVDGGGEGSQAVAPRFKAKVRPPRLNGCKVGVLATRSPHRPNPIGLSLAKIERVDGCRLWLSGVDIVDSTPILDIKPYVARYDALTDTRCASWIDTDAGVFAAVNFSLEAEERIERCVDNSSFYSSSDEIKTVLREVLRIDIRSLNQRMIHSHSQNSEKTKLSDLKDSDSHNKTYSVRIDNFIVEYVVDERRVVDVFSIRIDNPNKQKLNNDTSWRSTSITTDDAYERDHEEALEQTIP